ncbi:MAG TPA: hypothetical protein VK968_16055 [Roseimicrobium sp.]|nr:hypothetical protein [Roseimicrobium sp.]
MSKEVAKKAASAAMESTLLSLLPSIQENLSALRSDIKAMRGDVDRVDAKIEGLQEQMLDRFERTRDTINELGQRIARVEGKLDAFFETLKSQSGRMDNWLERLVKVEVASPSRRKKAS